MSKNKKNYNGLKKKEINKHKRKSKNKRDMKNKKILLFCNV